MVQAPAKERGAFLEDMVADLFRAWGFDVETRRKMQDASGSTHEIDVLCSKKESFGTIHIAVECKNVKAPIGIEEIRNFQVKLASLRIGKGIAVSTAGFTSEAETFASSAGIELWGLAALEEKLRKAQPEVNRIDDAFPLKDSILSGLLPAHIQNTYALSMTDPPKLSYHPYYLVDYHCFRQEKAGGEIVTLEVKGTVGVDGASGEIRDSSSMGNVTSQLPSMAGKIVKLYSYDTKTVLTSELPLDQVKDRLVAAEKRNITEPEAKATVQREVSKNTAMEYSYHLGRTKRSKAIRPVRGDVEVRKVRLCYVPLLEVTLAARAKPYKRLVEGFTGTVWRDDTLTCLTCGKASAILVCEDGGETACSSHGYKCLVCGKGLCDKHKVSKGFLTKKHYCSQHAPA